jgi:hypothetical protein
MKTNDIRKFPQFDYIPKDKWDKLTKQEFKDLMSYKGVYSHLDKNLKELERCKKRIKELKVKIEEGYEKLYDRTPTIDHLRDSYNISVSVFVNKTYKSIKDKKTYKYYSVCIQKRNTPKRSCNLGEGRVIRDFLYDYFKDSDNSIKMLNKKGWLRFLKDEVMYGEPFDIIFERNYELKGNLTDEKFSLEDLFPK